MSFTNQTKKNTYSGDGVTAAFAFSFPILTSTDLLVQIKDTNGTVTSKTITTHYTVSGTGNRTGFTDYTSGTVTFTAGNIPAATDTVIIKRSVPSTQETDYTEKGSFPADTHERALDKLTMLHIQQSEDIDRSIKTDSAVSGFDVTLPTPVADKYLKIKDDASGFELTGGTSINLADDSTPQLGGDLDTNGNNIQFDDAKGITDDSGNEQLIFQKTASAVNYVEVTNAATSNSPSVTAAGDDTNIDLTLDGKGSGTVKTTSSNLDITGNIVVSGTVDGRDIATDGTKLDGIETAADVTDETNVKAALDGATITGVTAAAGDKVLIQDVDDSDNLKTATVTSILGQFTNVETIKVHRSTTQTISTATFTKVQLDTEIIDTNSSFDSSTNYRWTPTVAGKYLVMGNVGITTPADGALFVTAIYKNGSQAITESVNVGGASEAHLNTIGIIEMNGSTDYLELYTYHTSGSDRDIQGGSNRTQLQGIYLGV